MLAIVSIETVLLVVLVVLVAALLRSHAEILRRLGPEGAGPPRLPDPPAGVRPETTAPEIAGLTPTGDAIKLSLNGRATLLAFLSSGCTSCARFWETLGERRLPDGLQPMIVTRGPNREQRSKLRALAPATVPVVMSSEAWEDYAVPGSPYFVLVEGGEIRGEGVITTWDSLTSLLGDALEEQREARGVEEQREARGVEEQREAHGVEEQREAHGVEEQREAHGVEEQREAAGVEEQREAHGVEERLAAAGIGPDHPSLFPEVRA